MKGVILVMKKNNSARIKVKYIGLCGSDINKLKILPTKEERNRYINMMGHEIVGVVEDISSDTEDFRIGDRVVVNPFIGCQECNACTTQSYNLCDNINSLGKAIPGGFTKEITVPYNSLFKISSNINPIEGVFIDSMSVVLHSFHTVRKFDFNKKVFSVIGDGIIAMIIIKLLNVYFNPQKIYLLCNRANRIDATLLNTYNNVEIINDYKDIKNNSYSDFVFETVGGGNVTHFNKSLEIAKSNALILVLGAFYDQADFKVNLRNMFFKQYYIKGVNSYCSIENDFQKAVDLLNDNSIKNHSLISHIYDINDVGSVIEEIINYKHPNFMKIVFKN